MGNGRSRLPALARARTLWPPILPWLTKLCLWVDQACRLLLGPRPAGRATLYPPDHRSRPWSGARQVLPLNLLSWKRSGRPSHSQSTANLLQFIPPTDTLWRDHGFISLTDALRRDHGWSYFDFKVTMDMAVQVTSKINWDKPFGSEGCSRIYLWSMKQLRRWFGIRRLAKDI